jgi:sulfonate transport system permease protein
MLNPSPEVSTTEILINTDQAKQNRVRKLGLLRLVSPVLFIALWQLAAGTHIISTDVLSSPEIIARAFGRLIASGELQSNLSISLRRYGIGVLTGTLIGLALGVSTGISRAAERFIDPMMQMFRTLPVLAMVPLFILWFGIGELPKIIIVTFAVCFPIYINVYSGIRSIDPRLYEAAKVFGLGQFKTLRQVTLPGAMAPALVGFRFALGIGLLALVVAEQINATSGVGYLMINAQQFFQTEVIFVGLVVYAILGLVTDGVVRILERVLLAWRDNSAPN